MEGHTPRGKDKSKSKPVAVWMEGHRVVVCFSRVFDMASLDAESNIKEARKQLCSNLDLKAEQAKVLRFLKDGFDTIACLSTGFGK